MDVRYGPIPIAPDGRRATLAAATGRILPADYRAAAEFIARDDSDDPALAVKNGDGRYWLFATRKTDLVPDRSSTHRQPRSSSALFSSRKRSPTLMAEQLRKYRLAAS
jgi:hypothetical protein